MIPKMPGVTADHRPLAHPPAHHRQPPASPSKIGDIARATLVLTHFEHGYIT
jgi:hypothetical protein